MSVFAVSQILVGIAICTDILSFQFKERKKIVSCLIVSCLMIALHFLLLGHYTAAGLGLVAALRFFCGLYSTSKWLMLFFIAVSVLVSAVTYAGLLSILGGLGSVFGTAGTFCRQDKQLRQLMLIGTSLWLVHNILAGSPLAVVLEAIFITSNVVGYYRYYIRPRRKLAVS